ncbi:MAG: sel1 repeat family protein [Elusimicrobia bacterium]|nr:sel1 repeat family protein [Elusimicrobiota bacterium]
MSDDQAHRAAGSLQSALEMLFSGTHDQEAFTRLLAAAESGDLQGQYLAGMLYALGKGTEKDLGKSLQWLTRAAEQGHPDAQYELSQRRASTN